MKLSNNLVLLFDLDGTLFDSTESNITAYREAFKEAGFILPIEKYKQNFGLRFDDMMKVLLPGISPQVLENIKRSKAKHYKNSLSLTRKNDELLDLIRRSRHSHKTALVTTARRENVVNLLDYFSVDPKLFDVIITGEDVVNGKPDPECYFKAIQALGVEPYQCTIYEDSDHGLAAARATGAHVVETHI